MGGTSSFFGAGRLWTPPLPSKKSVPPRFLSDFRTDLRGRGSKMGGSSIFGAEDRGMEMGRFFVLRLRRSKMGLSFFGAEDRRWGDSSKMEGFFEEPLPIFEDPIFEEPPHLRKTPICDLRPRKMKNPASSIFGAEDWVENRSLWWPRRAPPLRCAPPRPDPPVVCPGFGFDNNVQAK